MDIVYLCIIVFLFLLAVFDLCVGVSNDAVNFMNSAIGSKAASFRTVVAIVSLGVLCGAALSNGMMEIARHGIFRPEQFCFNDLMCIFLAVMVTDVVLLDVFNTLGMPTSTTVSMVFELLGGTFVLALIKIASDPTGFLSFGDLLNTEKALSVILGIFLSVGVAFFFGTLVQWLSRLLFTFSYGPRLKWTIGIFGGIATTAIIYFMLIKGLKDSAFMTPACKAWVHNNTFNIVLCCLAFFSCLMQALHMFGVNVFKVIVLLGTFALAMAFAGNDLVNFVGVPLAGYSAYSDYMASGMGHPQAFFMASLNSPAKTPAVFLFLSGVIMVVALVTSKKAQNVIKTSVDLSRQEEGEEMFGSTAIARSIVRYSTSLASSVSNAIPLSAQRWIDSRFNKSDAILADGAAFDLVRASVNLVLAGLLIALGTSLKLPLSTTYVAFMVAMGTSLADRAWSRQSAVFRITGVLSVIGGWFITAGAAFVICFFVTLFMFVGGAFAMVVMIALAVFVLLRSNLSYRRRQADVVDDESFRRMMASHDKAEVWSLLCRHFKLHLSADLKFASEAYVDATDGMVEENLGKLRKTSARIADRLKFHKRMRRRELLGLRKTDMALALEKNTWFHLGSNSCEQMVYCLVRLVDPCREHVDNHFEPLPPAWAAEFLPFRDKLVSLLSRAQRCISTGLYDDAEPVLADSESLKSSLSILRKSQLDRIQQGGVGLSISLVYLNVIQESQELASSLRHLLRANGKFQGITK